MSVQGIKSQSQKPENDRNGPKSKNFNFFGRNLFAMHKLAIILLRGHMKLEISHFFKAISITDQWVNCVYKNQVFGSKTLL